MFGGVYTSDFQKYRHYINLLAKEVFQKLMSIDKYNSIASVKISHRVKIKVLWQMLKSKYDGCSDVDLVLKLEAQS